jgi:hypothetical protein
MHACEEFVDFIKYSECGKPSIQINDLYVLVQIKIMADVLCTAHYFKPYLFNNIKYVTKSHTTAEISEATMN